MKTRDRHYVIGGWTDRLGSLSTGSSRCQPGTETHAASQPFSRPWTLRLRAPAMAGNRLPAAPPQAVHGKRTEAPSPSWAAQAPEVVDVSDAGQSDGVRSHWSRRPRPAALRIKGQPALIGMDKLVEPLDLTFRKRPYPALRNRRVHLQLGPSRELVEPGGAFPTLRAAPLRLPPLGSSPRPVRSATNAVRCGSATLKPLLRSRVGPDRRNGGVQHQSQFASSPAGVNDE